MTAATPAWERYERLTSIEDAIRSFAARRLAHRDISTALSRGEIEQLVEDRWPEIRDRATGVAEGRSTTMADRLSELEATSAGPDLIAQTVAYVGTALVNLCHDALRSQAYGHASLHDEGIAARLSVGSAAESAIDRISVNDAMALVGETLGPEVTRLFVADLAGWERRDEQGQMLSMSRRETQAVRARLQEATHLLRHALGVLIAPVMLPVGWITRRFASPESAEAAAIGGGLFGGGTAAIAGKAAVGAAVVAGTVGAVAVTKGGEPTPNVVTQQRPATTTTRTPAQAPRTSSTTSRPSQPRNRSASEREFGEPRTSRPSSSAEIPTTKTAPSPATAEFGVPESSSSSSGGSAAGSEFR